MSKKQWYKMEPRGLIVESIPTYKEWEASGMIFAELKRQMPFIIGDWLRVGDQTFHEKHSQALNIFGEYEYQTFANYKSVMERVPHFTDSGKQHRRDELTFGHHDAVAPLTMTNQRVWLEQAVKNNWTVQQLRNAINGEDPDAPPQEKTWIELVELAMSKTRDCLPDAPGKFRAYVEEAIQSLEDCAIKFELEGVTDAQDSEHIS